MRRVRYMQKIETIIKKFFVQSFLLFVFSIGFSLILTEVILNGINYEYHPLDIEIKEISDENDWRTEHAFADEDYVYDNKLLWRAKKSVGLFNEQGFIGTVVNSTSQNYKVFTIGDSNTAGTKEGISWPNYLESLLQKNNEDTVVVNAGIWGYTSFQGLARFEEIIHFNPDLVFISFGSNDAQPVLIADKDWNPDIKSFMDIFPFSLFSNLKISLLLKSLKDKTRILSNRNKELVHRVSLKDYERNLVKIIDLAEDNDIKLIFLTRPFIYNWEGEKENADPFKWKSYGPGYNNITCSAAKEHNIICFDVYSEFDGKKELFTDESHFTQEGYEIMANYIYEKLVEKEYVTQNTSIGLHTE